MAGEENTLIGGEAAPAEGAAGAAEEKVVAPAEKVVEDGVKDTPKPEAKEGEGAEGEKPEEKSGEKKDEKPIVPETYEFQLPDGMELDKERLAEAEPIFKDLGLTQEQAQKLVNLDVKRAQAEAEAQANAWTTLRSGWRDQVTADKEIGGQNLDQSLAHGNLAVNKFGTPELKEALKVYGMGDHPEFVRFCARVGKAMSEADVHFGKEPSRGPLPPEKRLYPDQN